MPTGACKYPEHHGRSAGQPIAWLVLIALGAIVVTHWHDFVVALVVTGVLAGLGVAVLLLRHNHGRGTDPELEQRAALEEAQRRRLAAQQRAAVETPRVVHNHLHLHSISPVAITGEARNPSEDN